MKKPFDLSLWLRQGNQLYREGKVQEARLLFKRAIDAKREYGHAWFMLGTLEQREKNLGRAAEALEKAVSLEKAEPGYQVRLAQVYIEMDRKTEAEELVKPLSELDSISPKLYLPLGKVFAKLEQHEEAKGLFEQALEAEPQNPFALNHLGKSFQALEQLEEAKKAFLKLIKLSPDIPQPYLNYGHILQAQNKDEEAFLQYQSALSKRPNWWPAYEGILSSLRKQLQWPALLQWLRKAEQSGGRQAGYWELAAQAYTGMRQPAKAIKACQAALSIDPERVNAVIIMASAMNDVGLQHAALKQLEKLVELRPEISDAWLRKSNLHVQLKQYEPAYKAITQALSLPHPTRSINYDLTMIRANLFDWEHWEAARQLLMDTVDEQLAEEKDGGFIPVLSLNYFDLPPAYTLKAAIHTGKGYQNATKGLKQQPFIHEPRAKQQLKVAYLSPDFRQHAVGMLISGMFELHSRERVETFAYSLMNLPEDDIQRRVKAGVDHFIDASTMSVETLAQHIYQNNIDILVDLGGYTTYTRTEMLALKPAPVQVQYIGLLDTMGAPYIGHTIADAHCIPPELEAYYTEKVWHLPCAFVATKMAISPQRTSRTDWALPEKGVVYANFNGNYKFSPKCFQSWMNILKAVPDSVLWLTIRGDKPLQERLLVHAEAAGMDPERLVFSPTVSMPEHLERMRHADLFLDTFNFNAGATGVSALQAGLPLLTLSGNTYASRIGGSLAKAAGTPEMVCNSQEEFEQKGIEFGKNPHRLAKLRQRLLTNQDESDLFNLPKSVRALEDIFHQMWELQVGS